MSVKRSVGLEDNGDKAVARSIVGGSSKRARRSLNRCFSFMEVAMEPAVVSVSSLKELDSNKFKAEIKRWAKAVVGYARQLSGRV
ncbi:hypothetical protein GQ457_03G041210 [Hibiscus cannabinus]